MYVTKVVPTATRRAGEPGSSLGKALVDILRPTNFIGDVQIFEKSDMADSFRVGS
jgi:hypothetical protein